jgi:hypothetical protein
MATDGDDDLDALVRTAMKTLDEQASSGYFEALPSRTLERLALEEGTMQAGSTSGSEAKSSSVTTSAAPPKVEEDSGLHDIRSLAQTTKERISSKRITSGPIKTDEELLASASGSWKSLALPQPASMVSLPELADLPPAAVVDKSKPASHVETSKPMFAATVAQHAAPATSSRKLMAIAGLGIAAAAGVTLLVTMQSKPPASDGAAAKSEPTLAMATTPTAPPAPAAPVVQHIDEPAAGSAAAVVVAADHPTEAAAAPEPTAPPKVATKSRAKVAVTPAAHAAKPTTIASKDQAPASAPESKKAESGGKGDATGKAVANGQESLDQLIKEAGAEDKPKAGPTLDKKELSANDFKAGMSAIQGKAQACFKGTQGMAQVKLVIVPSGKVTRVTVTGKFSGQPEAACVTSAVKSATFPPWDGGSQTMGYSFLLSE